MCQVNTTQHLIKFIFNLQISLFQYNYIFWASHLCSIVTAVNPVPNQSTTTVKVFPFLKILHLLLKRFWHFEKPDVSFVRLFQGSLDSFNLLKVLTVLCYLVQRRLTVEIFNWLINFLFNSFLNYENRKESVDIFGSNAVFKNNHWFIVIIIWCYLADDADRNCKNHLPLSKSIL